MTTISTNQNPGSYPTEAAAAVKQVMPMRSEFAQRYREAADAAVATPFKGVTTDGTVVSGLYKVEQTGVSTAPIAQAAQAFLASLRDDQRAHATFPLDTDWWRRWSNIHPLVMRHGLAVAQMDPAQAELAFGLLRASLSAPGFELARDVMRLNETVAEMTGKFDEYGERFYWFSIMGTPSESEPWGWQVDGHHLIINYVVVGDQVTMTPAFLGSEPVVARSGKYDGTRVFAPEEEQGLAFMQNLTDAQREMAVVGEELPPDVFTTAFRDNFELRYEGIRYSDLTPTQQRDLLALIRVYTGRLREGHDQVRFDEVKAHLDETHFAWIGGFEHDSVFYYRIHSPVILIEFDHQRGVAFREQHPEHYRDHIHTVVRTPNGNDYGKDLLRQHHLQHKH